MQLAAAGINRTLTCNRLVDNVNVGQIGEPRFLAEGKAANSIYAEIPNLTNICSSSKYPHSPPPCSGRYHSLCSIDNG